MGMRLSLPNALVLIRTPGGIWRRLYSAPSTRAHDPVDERRGEALGHEVRRRAVPLDVTLEHRVELLVGRERLVVTLVGTQLGRRRLVEHAVGDGRGQAIEHGLGVAIPAQVVDQRLGDVLDHREPTCGVPVEGGVARGHLALVPCGQHDPSSGIGKRHQDDAAQAGLEVLVGQAERLAPEHGGEHGREGDVRLLNGHDREIDPESRRQGGGVVVRCVTRIARRHGDAVHPRRAEGIDGDRRHE